jgi:hypothetical protein
LAKALLLENFCRQLSLASRAPPQYSDQSIQSAKSMYFVQIDEQLDQISNKTEWTSTRMYGALATPLGRDVERR